MVKLKQKNIELWSTVALVTISLDLQQSNPRFNPLIFTQWD
jgi:hypothetical protein